MANRGRHYEEAFEDFLAAEGIPYVPVTLAQRQAFQAARIKAFDFVVWPSSGPNWLVDIKGRAITTGRLDNWVTQGDLDGLTEWQSVFGDGFVGVFVFVFHVQKPELWRYEQAPLYGYRGASYSFWSTTVDDYRRSAKVRSARWNTYTAEPEVFLSVAEPVGRWLISENGPDRGPFVDGPPGL
jgi:hypothetical protein